MLPKRSPTASTPPSVVSPATGAGSSRIANGWFTIAPRVGASGLAVQAAGREGNMTVAWLAGLTLRTVEDPWDSRGGHYDQAGSHSLNTVRHTWQIVSTEIVESGPLRSILLVKFRSNGGASGADLTIQLEAGRRAVAVEIWSLEKAGNHGQTMGWRDLARFIGLRPPHMQAR
jgi:hypothetical protein